MGLLEIVCVCVCVLVSWSIWFCVGDNLTIVPKALNSEGSASGNGTMLTELSLQIAKVQLFKILLVLSLYHWCVSGFTV